MVSTLDSVLSGLGSGTGQGHCVLFLGKTLNSPPRIKYTDELSRKSGKNAGGLPAMDWHPIYSVVE